MYLDANKPTQRKHYLFKHLVGTWPIKELQQRMEILVDSIILIELQGSTLYCSLSQKCKQKETDFHASQITPESKATMLQKEATDLIRLDSIFYLKKSEEFDKKDSIFCFQHRKNKTEKSLSTRKDGSPVMFKVKKSNGLEKNQKNDHQNARTIVFGTQITYIDKITMLLLLKRKLKVLVVRMEKKERKILGEDIILIEVSNCKGQTCDTPFDKICIQKHV